MKKIGNIIYNIYFNLVVLPIALVLTIITALVTFINLVLPKSKFVHWVQEAWSRSFFRLLLIPVRVEGLEHIEPGKSYVFVCNHQSMFDVWLVFGWLPVIFKWMMKKEIRRIPLVGVALQAAGHIFVDRSNPREAIKSMSKVEEALRGGACTVIFPEGTRTKTGKMGSFKRGAFQIAIDLGLPVIPISISGCWNVMKPGQWWVNRCPVKMYVGKPIEMPANLDREGQLKMIEHVHDLVEAHVE